MNPWYCYTASFVVAFGVYSLGWSELYPKLSLSLVAFLISTFAVHLLAGRRFQKSGVIRFRSLRAQDRAAVLITLFIYFLWIVEFVYEGGIPLLKIILKQPFNYRLFGVPSLHVFVVTFSSFYTAYLFHLFLSRRSGKILLLYLINLSAGLLIYNRGMLFFNLATSLFIYFVYLKKIVALKIILISLSLIPLFYFFGMLGSLRVSREAKEPYNNENFMETGQATQKFRQSIIPKEYFWAYIYISSPVANLQENINEYPVGPLSFSGFAKMLNNEVLPDFLSKRINRLFQLEPNQDKRIPGPFNVSTTYSRSYSYAGWFGLILMAIIMASVPFLFLKLLPADSNFFLSGWAILCTMYFFMVYDNTLRFTGLSFQLVYPILLHWLGDRFSFRKALS